MAIITTGGSGDWNSVVVNAPWPGGTKPTTSDTVVIASGHTITVSTTEDTWGTSPAAATAAATITDVVLTVTGTLTIQSTGTLTVRGSINGTGTLNNNSTTGLVFDASSAGTPSSQNYSIKMTGGSVNATGAAGARALFTSNDATGGRGFFNSGAYATNFTYVRCYKLAKAGATSGGNGSTNWNGSTTGNQTWSYVEWDTCGRIDATVGATVNIDWANVTVKNPSSTTQPADMRLGFTRATTGLRRFRNIILTSGCIFNTDCKDVDVNGWLIHTPNSTDWQFKMPSTLTNNVVVQNVLVNPGVMASNDAFRIEAGGTYSYIYSLTGARHTAQLYNTVTGVVWNLDNWIAESDTSSGNQADLIVPRSGTAGALATTNLSNSIILPNTAPSGTAGRTSGSILAGVNTYSADHSVYITHCTQMIDANATQGGTYVNESSGNTAIGGRLLEEYRGNLLWCDTGATGAYGVYNNGTNRGGVAARNVDANAHSGLVTAGSTATTMACSGALKWDYTSGTNNLWYNYTLNCRGNYAYVRILTGATAPQIAQITGQTSATVLNVASWPNGTPAAGDAWEIYIPNQVEDSMLDYNAYYRIAKTNTLYTHDAAGTTVANNWHRDLYLDNPALVDAHSVDLGTSGTQDTAGPQFIDSSRNSLTWQTSKGIGGGSPSVSTLVTELAKCNDDSGRTLTGALSTNIIDLITYVQAGFAPQNSTLATAAHDGTTIGAVAYISSSSDTAPLGLSLTLV